MGRHRKSIEEHKKNGTYKPSLHDLPDISGKVEAVEPYVKLKPNAERVFYELVADIRANKQLAPEDMNGLTNLAMLGGIIEDLYVDVIAGAYTETGSTGSNIINPRIQIFFKAQAEYKALSKDMGIGPMARLRLALNQKELNKEEKPKVDLD